MKPMRYVALLPVIVIGCLTVLLSGCCTSQSGGKSAWNPNAPFVPYVYNPIEPMPYFESGSDATIKKITFDSLPIMATRISIMNLEGEAKLDVPVYGKADASGTKQRLVVDSIKYIVKPIEVTIPDGLKFSDTNKQTWYDNLPIDQTKKTATFFALLGVGSRLTLNAYSHSESLNVGNVFSGKLSGLIGTIDLRQIGYHRPSVDTLAAMLPGDLNPATIKDYMMRLQVCKAIMVNSDGKESDTTVNPQFVAVDACGIPREFVIKALTKAYTTDSQGASENLLNVLKVDLR